MASGVTGDTLSGLLLTNEIDLQHSDADPAGKRSKDDRSN